MAQRLVELCTVFVEQTYGELASQIFSTLARCGRSSLATLAQVTRLPAPRLRTGLAILLKHHLALHYTHEDKFTNLPTFYTVDLDAAYSLSRSHKFIRIVNERYGEAAGQLLTHIIEHGHLSVNELEKKYDFTAASKRDSGIQNGEHHETKKRMSNGMPKESSIPTTIATRSDLHSTLQFLLDEHILTKVTERSYIPKADYEEEVKQTVINANEKFQKGKTTGAKNGKKFNAEVESLKRKWEEEDSYSKKRDVASQGIIKRSKDSAPSNKRAKLNGDSYLTNGVHDDLDDEHEGADECVSKLADDLYVRANYAKCTLLLRNARLTRMVHYNLGPVTAGVFDAVLSASDAVKEAEVKSDQGPLKEEDSDDEMEVDDDDEEEEGFGQEQTAEPLVTVTDFEVLEHLDKSIDLSETVKVPRPSKPQNGKHRKKVLSDDPDEAELGIKVEQESDDEEDVPAGQLSLKEQNKRLALINTHLNILAEHPKRFVKRQPGRQTSQIDIKAITKKLIEDEVDAMISHRFSKHEMRLVRILRDTGCLEEKSLQWASMLPVVPLRQHLTFLKFAKICDCQEVPKDDKRIPNRMLHLWQFDEKRVVNRYLHQTYQGMARLMQRTQIAREEKFAAVLEKAERVGDEALLNKGERELLGQWREMEETTLVQIDRMDDLVGVLRDFPGDTHSLMT